MIAQQRVYADATPIKNAGLTPHLQQVTPTPPPRAPHNLVTSYVSPYPQTHASLAPPVGPVIYGVEQPQPYVTSNIGHYGQVRATQPIYRPDLYQNIQGYTAPRETERRVTYHPFLRHYIDYEAKMVRVPIERVRVNYYEKVTETSFVPKAFEETIIEEKPVEKEVVKVQYIPVETQVVHVPKAQMTLYDDKGRQIHTKERLVRKSKIVRKVPEEEAAMMSKSRMKYSRMGVDTEEIILHKDSVQELRSKKEVFGSEVTPELPPANPMKESEIRENNLRSSRMLQRETMRESDVYEVAINPTPVKKISETQRAGESELQEQ